MYAFGEVILVVIGILIALQVNNWNEIRKDKNTEQVYLYELLEDLKTDSIVLHDRIQRAIDNHITDAEIILNYIEKDSIYAPSLLVRNMITSGFMAFFDANLTTYNELVNSGNLKLIKDKSLKEKLNGYISYNKQIDDRYEWNKRTIWYDYGNYIREEYLDGRVYGSIYSGLDEVILEYPIDWKKFKRDELLRKKLTYVISSARAEKRWHTVTMEKIVDLINHLEKLIDHSRI